MTGTVRVYRGVVYGRYNRFEKAVEQDFVPGDYAEYGAVCPQDPEHLLRQLGEGAGLRMEEGVLCLSIAAPEAGVELVEKSALKTSGDEIHHSNGGRPLLPVMVWIHGGSYLTGGSEDHRYDVAPLAEAGGVVVVKISYRLGAPGYLYNEREGVGNLGLEDQRTALRWIRKHISAFGGDPENVTLWGQSAGAHSVASLIATSTPGEPLFSKAILQSAPLGVKMTCDDAEGLCSLFLRRLAERAGDGTEGDENLDKSSNKRRAEAMSGCRKGKFDFESAWELARRAPIEDIIAVQTSMRGKHLAMPFMPVLEDNMFVPGHLGSATEPGVSLNLSDNAGGKIASSPSAPEGHSPLKVLLYYNSEDASVYARKFLGSALYGTPLGRLATKIITDYVFKVPAEKYLKRLREKAIEAKLLRFSWSPAGSPLRCCHSIELPFLLGHPEDWVSAEMLQGITEEEFQYYSKAFKTIWTEFARSGGFPTGDKRGLLNRSNLSVVRIQKPPRNAVDRLYYSSSSSAGFIV